MKINLDFMNLNLFFGFFKKKLKKLLIEYFTNSSNGFLLIKFLKNINVNIL
jgi:hypothetical protein